MGACCCSTTSAARGGPIRALQWLVERVTIRAAGEHFTRRQLPLVVAAGLAVEEAERVKAGTVERVAARRPAVA